MKLAFLGMGTMGAPMALNLLKAGHELTVWNRSANRCDELAAAGATVAVNPRAAAEGAEVLMLCVSDGPDVEEVLASGSDPVLQGISSGALLVDFSTISPALTRDLAQRFADKGVGYVDAPVSGGSEGAIKGTLAIMCGGSEGDFERARPLLEIVGAKATLVGPVGAGQVTKAVNQVLIAGTYQALAEGLCLADGQGVDPERVVEAIGSGAAASWVLANRSANMIADDYPLGFRMKLHRKDLAIALEAARQNGQRMRVAEIVAELEDGLIESGAGDEDMSALARGARKDAGRDPGRLG